MERRREWILASSSPRRREILEQVGIAFRIVTSGVEEVIPAGSPAEVVRALAKQKAEAVAAACAEKGTLILGADTVVACDGRILGKPKDARDAYRMIELLQGREHEVYTGVALIADGCCASFAERTLVKVARMEPEEIRSYTATPEPYDKAGGYAVQGRFARYIEKIDGDYYNVVGLPICRICREAEKRGW